MRVIKDCRRGFTLVEISIFGFIGLVLVGMVVALMCTAGRHDAFTAERLDRVATLASAITRMREDVWRGRAVVTGPDGLKLEVHGKSRGAPETVEYRWGGRGEQLRRAGSRVGVAPLGAFTVNTRDGTAQSVSIGGAPSARTDAGPRITVVIPLNMPDTGHKQRFHFYKIEAPEL